MTLSTESVIDERTFCAVHPTVETGLKCARCGRYMCTKCAVHTEVGYKCRQCIYSHQDAFYKATQRDHIVAAGVALVLGVIFGVIVPRTFAIGALFLGPAAGALIGWAILRLSGKRRGRIIPYIAVGAILITGIIVNFGAIQELLELIDAMNSVPGADVLSGILVEAALPLIIYLIACPLVAYSRLR